MTMCGFESSSDADQPESVPSMSYAVLEDGVKGPRMLSRTSPCPGVEPCTVI